MHQGIYKDFIGKDCPHPPQNQTTDKVDAQPVQNCIVKAGDQAMHGANDDIEPGHTNRVRPTMANKLIAVISAGLFDVWYGLLFVRPF